MALMDKIATLDAKIKEMKVSVGLEENVSLDELVAKVESGGGATVKSNIYKVATIEERDAITDMVEGDMCVVHANSMANMQVTDSVTSITFPATVVLPEAITDYLFISLRDADYTTDIMGDMSSTGGRFDINMDSGRVRIGYTSTDGITYTRTDTYDETIEFSSPVSCAYVEEWNDLIGYFLQVGGVTFNGIFEYKDNNWIYANIGLNIKQNEVLKGTTVYSTAGFLEGNLAEDSNTDTVANVNSIMSSMSNITLPTDCTRFLAKSQLQDSEYLPITKILNTSGVTNMYYMISDFPNLKELDISNFNTADVTNMEGFLKTNPMLEKINLSNLDTSKVTTMQGLLSGNTSLDNVDISHFNLSSCTSLSGLFYGNSNLTNYKIPKNWGLVNTMYQIFYGCSKLTSIDLSDVVATSLKHFGSAFQNCSSLTEVKLNGIQCSKISSFDSTFAGCSNLTALDINFFDTSECISFQYTFRNCSKLKEINISNWTSSKVIYVQGTFEGCTSLEKIDMRKITFDSVGSGTVYYNSMFKGVPANCLIIVKNSTVKSWITSKFSHLTNVKTVSEYGG